MRPELERRLAVVVEPLSRAVLDGVCEFEAEPDRTRVELGIVPVFADERPLLGFAGLLDWRGSGRLSAILRSGFFTGAESEQLLTLGERRWPIDRLVLLGVGPRAAFDEAAARRLASRCVELASGLAAESVLIALPSGPVDRSLVELAFDSLLGLIEQAGHAHAQHADPAEPEAAAEVEISAGEGAPSDEIPAAPEPEVESEAAPAAPAESEPAAEAVAEPASAAPAADASASAAGSEASVAPAVPADPAAAASATPGPAPAVPAEPAFEAPAESAQPELSEGAKSQVDGSALESQSDEVPEADEPRWWVVADEAVVARLRRVRSGPPRAARGGPSLYT